MKSTLRVDLVLLRLLKAVGLQLRVVQGVKLLNTFAFEGLCLSSMETTSSVSELQGVYGRTNTLHLTDRYLLPMDRMIIHG